eukprot:scaffold248432_cov80-Cyclotella_meneghiniana.AAC.2
MKSDNHHTSYNDSTPLNLHAIVSIEHEQKSYNILQFCAPIDLLNLAVTSKLFGYHENSNDNDASKIKSKRRKNNKGKKANANREVDVAGNIDQLSLIEEAARIMVVSVTNPAAKDICKRKGRESWLKCYHRLHLFRHELVFNRIIGRTMSYVKNDPRHIQGMLRSSMRRELRTSLAMCQEVMTTGVHSVQFRVTKSTGYDKRAPVQVGVIRPIENLVTTKSIRPFHLHVFTNCREFVDYCNQETTFKGGVDHANCHRTVKAGDVLEIQLDLNEGYMKVMDKADDSEIFRQSGLAGPYCWCVIIQSSHMYSGAALRVKRITATCALKRTKSEIETDYHGIK